MTEEKLVVAGAISNLFDKKYFEEFNLWFEEFNVIMNANDMDFKQKDLKTILKINQIKKMFIETFMKVIQLSKL